MKNKPAVLDLQVYIWNMVSYDFFINLLFVRRNYYG